MKKKTPLQKAVNILLVAALFFYQQLFAQTKNTIAEDDTPIHSIAFLISSVILIIGFVVFIVLKLREDRKEKKQQKENQYPTKHVRHHPNHYGHRHHYNH